MDEFLQKMITDVMILVAKTVSEPKIAIQRHHMVGRKVLTNDFNGDDDMGSGVIVDVIIENSSTKYLVKFGDQESQESFYIVDPDDITQVAD